MITIRTIVGSVMCVGVLAVPLQAGAITPPKDPCSVLTPQEVSAALGTSSTGATHPVATLCEWDAAGQAGKKLTLGFLDAQAWEQTKAYREQIKAFTRTPVAGLGEEAVFSTNGTISTLQVKKGAYVLDMHMYGIPPDQAKDKQIVLARAALGRF